MIRSIRLSRLLLFILVMVLLFLSLFLYVSSSASFHRRSIDKTPDWYMKSASGFHTNVSGVLDGSLQGQTLTHYLKSNTIHITAPFFVVFDNKNIPWKIHANFGIGYQTEPEKLKLWGKVDVLQLAGTGSQQTHLTTSELWYYPKTKLAHTDQAVIVTQNDGSTVHAIGMDADLKTGKLHFLSHTEIEYHDTSAT